MIPQDCMPISLKDISHFGLKNTQIILNGLINSLIQKKNENKKFKNEWAKNN